MKRNKVSESIKWFIDCHGGKVRKGLLYFLLIDIGFVYLYPLIYMVTVSLMPPSDLVNPTIKWIPTHLDLSNFGQVIETLNYGETLTNTLIMAVVASLLQIVSCSLAGYALARCNVPLKKFWVGALILIFLIPTSLTLVPQYVLFNSYNMIGSLVSIWLPALLGQGLNSSLFVLIFMQSFSSYPKAYDEAARLDGAGRFKIFTKVALPMVVPVIILTFLFSFVWYWNETAKSGLYLSGQFDTLPLQLENFDSLFGSAFPSTVGSAANRLSERVQMAATLVVFLPVMLLYLLLQKHFIQGIEASGITGE